VNLEPALSRKVLERQLSGYQAQSAIFGSRVRSMAFSWAIADLGIFETSYGAQNCFLQSRIFKALLGGRLEFPGFSKRRCPRNQGNCKNQKNPNG